MISILQARSTTERLFKSRLIQRVLSLSLAGVIYSAIQVGAATLYWDGGTTNIGTNGDGLSQGGNGTWSTAIQNWDRGSGLSHVVWTNANSDTAYFGGLAGTVSLSSAITAGGLTFNVGGYTLTSGTLTLNMGSVITTNGGVTTFDSSLNLAGGAGVALTKTGPGTLSLSTNNFNLGTAASPAVWTVTGGIFSGGVFDSILSIGFGSSLGATPTNPTTQLILDAGTLQVTTVGSPAVGSNRTFQVNAAGGAIRDSSGGNNTYQDGIVDNAGSSSSLFLSNTGGTTTFSGVISGTGSLTWSGSGTLALTASNTFTGGILLNSGVLSISTGSSLGGSVSGSTLQLDFAGNSTLQIGANNLSNTRPLKIESGVTAIIDTGSNTGSGVQGVISGGGGLTKIGTGTLTLVGVETYMGATTVNVGTLALQSSGSNSSVLSTSSALVLGGGNLTATNGTTGIGINMSQSVSGVTLNSGGSAIALTQGAGSTNKSVVLNLGAITRNAGSTINFTLPAGTQSSTNGITTTTANTATSILGGWATVGLNDWAVSGGNGSTAGNISALSSYFTYDNVSGWLGAGAGPTSNMTDSNGYDATYTNSITLNSLRFNASASDSNVGVVNGQNLTLGSGGLLVTNNVGGKYQRIGFLNTSFTLGQGQGGLTLPGSGDLVINQNNSGSGHLEIYSTIFGTGVNLVKSGVGFLDLRGLAASYTGTTTIDAGTLQVSGGDDRLPTSTAMTINAGTLNLAGVNQTLGGLTGSSTAIIDHSGTNSTLTVNLASGTNTYGGVIQNTAGTLGLTKSGAGTEVLPGASTYTGTTLVTGTGKLEVTNNSSSTGGRLTATTAITVNNGGTLLLSGVGSADRINNAAGVTLGSIGTNTVAAAGGAKEGSAATVVGGTPSGTNAFGIGALTLTSAARLDFDSASNGNLLVFNGFSGSATLTITNWTNSNYNGSSTSGLSTDDRLVFNQNMSGFLSQFDFGSGAGVGVTELNLGGTYYEVGFTPVPEPSTVAATSLLLGLLVYRERKLLKARWRKVTAASR